MNRNTLENALDEISGKYIAEAAKLRRSRLRWAGPLAAVLATVILVSVFIGSLTSTGTTSGLSHGRIAAPVYPVMAAYPSLDSDGYKAWQQSQKEQYSQPKGYAAGTENFFRSSIQSFLADCETDNTVCSPVNVYMALAMLAETAGGKTRQQILDLLGSGSIEALRTQAGYVWNAHYCDDKATTSKLGNSLWLADWIHYKEDTVETLAKNYYASVYHGKLGDPKMQRTIRDWLNAQTDGLLSEQVGQLDYPDMLDMLLASTVYYRVKWANGFNEDRSTQDIFHAPQGDATVTYMHRTIIGGTFYWGEDFTAVRLALKDDGHMWLILPNEGLTPAELLTSGHAAELALRGSAKEREAAIINLSLPKFDIAADRDITPGLKSMGITDAFTLSAADFTSISYNPIYVDRVQHAARVTIDEDGIVAASYTIVGLPEAVEPELPDKEIDFTLDRPFLFFITSRDNLPLFAGVVNNP